LLGGGPTLPVTAEETASVRSVLERIQRVDPAGAAALSRPSGAPSVSAPLAENVHRPVVIAEPADALREGSDALGEKGWVCRLAELENPDPPGPAADRFLARVDAVVTELGDAPFLRESRGVVVFAPLSFDLPEGADERPAVAEFLQRVATTVRRREMTVAAYATGGGPRGTDSVPGGVVGPGAIAAVRPIRLRQGITDVGVLATAAVPRRRAG
jgi:hypothetical protein